MPTASDRNPQAGALVVSLDFELHWGVRDRAAVAGYRENLLGARRVVPMLLECFAQHGIHATWATVGFLFFETRAQLLAGLPAVRPQYAKEKLSPYPELDGIGENEADDPFHYAASLLRLVASAPGQEIGTHTFSHHYCLEPGQTVETFRADLQAAAQAAARMGLALESLVFPRNQFNADYLSVCGESGIRAYRGNEARWLYRAHGSRDESPLRRVLRFADAYFPIAGHTSYALAEGSPHLPKAGKCGATSSRLPVNVPSSRFLRPYSPALRMLEPLRLRRVRKEMTYAAEHGLLYHLWWHPHNFGKHVERNLAALEEILAHFDQLRDRYGMESLHMSEAATRALAAGSTPLRQVTHAG
jgi:hypothetical protein